MRTADVLAAWRETLGDAFWVVPQDEAIDRRALRPVVSTTTCGPGSATCWPSRCATTQVVDSRRAAAGGARTWSGMHGALTEEELGVPLLVHRA